MPNLITCPDCSRSLQVPDELLGQQVKCPSCGATFTGAAAPPTAIEEDRPWPASENSARKRPTVRRKRDRDYDDDYDDDPDDDFEDRPRRRRRRDFAPHRGSAVLVLGIVGLFVFPIILGPIA